VVTLVEIKVKEMKQTFPYVVKVYYEVEGQLKTVEFQEYDDLEYSNIGKILQRMEDKIGYDKIKNILVQPDVPNLTSFGRMTPLTLH
jgi:hypothetical protein